MRKHNDRAKGVFISRPRAFACPPALALAPNLDLPVLAPNLYLPALTPNLCLPTLTETLHLLALTLAMAPNLYLPVQDKILLLLP